MSVEKLAAVWPDWRVVEQIGAGSFGKVYKVVRQELSVTTYAAVKVITIPQNDAEIASLRSEGMDENATRAYLQGVVNDFINEVKLMESLKGTSNIVSVEDFKVVPYESGIGWDIFIRMELLTPFNDYLGDRQMTEKEVVRLGIDMCTALELCSKRKIIHRDIKPENIFVSPFGDYKIGDFGIAKELEKTSGALSSKGTYNYIAPEVVMGKRYDSTVDIYSLGLVLYKLLNNNRLPFIDPYAKQIQYQDRKNAVDRRLSGETLPAPVNASEAMTSVILAACAYSPEGRFSTPTAMKKALLNLDTISKTAIMQKIVNTDIAGVQKDGTAVNKPLQTVVKAQPEAAVQKKQKQSTAKRKGSKLKIIIPLVAVLAVFAVAGFAAFTYVYPASKAVECFENGDYKGAEEYLVKVSADNSILIDGLNGHLDAIQTGFESGSMSYDDAIREIESIESLNIPKIKERLAEVRAAVVSLNDTRLVEQIVNAVSSGDYQKALELYNGVQNDEGVLGNEIKKHLDRLYKSFEKGELDFADAYAALDSIEEMQVEGLDGKISQIRDDLDKLSDSRQAFETAKAFEDKGSYQYALEYYRNVSSDDSNYAEAQQAVERVTEKYRQQISDTAKAYANEGDYVSALECLDKGLTVLPDDGEILSQRADCVTAFEDFKLAQATTLIEQGEYDMAQAEITYALEIVPESERLKEMLQSVESCRPAKLSTLTVVDSKGYSLKQEEFTDSYGNKYDGCYMFDSSYADSYAVYNLDGQYSLFTCNLIATADTSSDSSFTVEIYLDDKEEPEYRITDFKKTTSKQYVSLDVTSVTKLEIRVLNCNTNYSRIAVVDGQVEK